MFFYYVNDVFIRIFKYVKYYIVIFWNGFLLFKFKNFLSKKECGYVYWYGDSGFLWLLFFRRFCFKFFFSDLENVIWSLFFNSINF